MLKTLPIAVIGILLLTACQRELSPPEPQPDPPARLTGHPLKEVAINDSLTGFTHKVNFYYDASTRVVKMTFRARTGGFPIRPPHLYTDSFYYTGTNTNPWKIISTLDTGAAGCIIQNYFSYLTYDGSGRKIKDSVYRDDGTPFTTIRNYGWAANYQTDLPSFNDTVFFSGGNMQKMNRATDPRSYNPFIYRYNSYDNKHNPYYDLNIAQAYFKRHLYPTDDFVQSTRIDFQGAFNMQSLNTNNITQWQLERRIIPDPGLNAIWRYYSTYTYNTDDYPVKQDMHITMGPLGVPTSWHYNTLKYTYSYY